MYRWHFAAAIALLQKALIPLTSTFFVIGFASLARKYFNSLHTLSMGLKSALLVEAGHPVNALLLVEGFC